MRKKLLLFISMLAFALYGFGQNAWINELHYDNASTDVNEFVEVVIENSGSYALSDFAIFLYNGSNGTTYGTETIDNFAVGTTVGDFTIYYWINSGIQNGAPDGLALVYQGTVISGQFLSYEGFLTATDGPANGLTSDDIGVAETGSTPIGESLQLSGSGTSYPDFTWNPPAAETPGNENNGQSLGGSLDPEPSNYPINLTADATGLVIDNTWTDATGTQLPSAYLVLISDQDNIVPPVDGTFQSDDTDISDGSGAINVAFGNESSTFFRLQSVTTYFIEIYPYTNAGANVDYKTDGTAPQASATSAYAINTEDFETGDFGTWTTFNVASDKDWAVEDQGGALGTLYFAQMNGYNEDVPSNDWLISPSLDLSGFINEVMVFYTMWKYGNDDTELILKYSTNYTGGDPTLASWINLPFSVAASSDTWESSGLVDLSAISGTNVHIAFQYLSSGSPRRWNVDEIEITGDMGSGPTAARIVGSMQGWNETDPDYVMSINANGIYELTKSLDAGSHEYKVLEGDTWSDPSFPPDNVVISLSATEDVTWKANITDDFVIHVNPVVVGDFLSVIGGINWEPTELMGEMSDPDGDDIFTLELTIPAGNYEAKVTLNYTWAQNTGGNVSFVADGVNPTIFTYNFTNNTTTISGPPPPTVLTTFMVEDIANMNYDGFFLKGSWDANGQYDPSWGGGAEHSAFYDDGTNGDAVAGDHIWTCQQELVIDGGSNTWAWGVNDSESNWIAGNWEFTVSDDTPQTHTWIVPDVVDLVINEIMYNSPGYDEEWIELYNNTTQTIDLENWRVCDEDANHTPIVITAGYSIAAGEYFTISIDTDGAFPFTPDFDGTGNFALNNGGDAIRIWNNDNLLVDIVVYDDGSPWPTEPDGDGPTLSLIDPDTDNSLAESWLASIQDGGTPGAENFPPIPYVTITSPNGGEFIAHGDAYDITWVFDFWTGDIDIKLVKEGYSPVVIGSDIAVADGIWIWNVSAAIQIGNDYKIMIVPVNPDDPSDESDDFFSITEPYVMPEIVITEIMYNPPESGTDSLEFLELYNNGDETVNLEGFHFTEGVEFIFPSIDLLPDNYILVAVNSESMMNTFGVEAMQWTAGGLSNGGEDIELQDSFNNVIDFVLYDDNLPWDTLADGFGPSLTLCNPDVDNSIAENWTHSINLAAINTAGDSIWATPGFGCVAELLPGFEADITSIEVGESVMFTDLTIGDPIEWIWYFEGGTPDTWNGQTPPEIYYNEEGLWDVTLYVSDGANVAEVTYTDYIEVIYIPDPFVTITDPNGGEFISQGDVYDISWIFDFWTGDIDIKLVKGADAPVLLGSNISVEDGSWTWDVSPTQQLGDDFKIMIVPVDPADPSDESDDYFSIIEPYVAPEIVITEIMYNPPESGTDSLEFLELYNNGDETVNLEGFYFEQGIEYVFPNIDLLPDNYLLVAVNAASMMNTFGVDALQWTSGGLSNGGEEIELRDSFDNVIDSLTYDDNLPWDPLADGNGPSLTLCNPSVDNSIAENWTHSVNFAAVNAVGDSIWATPGFGCQIDLLPGFNANVTSVIVGDYVTFTDLTLGDPIDWKWTFEGGIPEIYFGQTPPEIYYNEVGTWDVTLFVSDGNTNALITYPNYIEVINLPPPTSLEAEVGPYDDVQLTWDAPSTRGELAELLGYNVYRDGIQINDVIVEITEYYDEVPPIGSHDYYVTAMYNGGESSPSNVVSIVVTDINDVIANSVKIYPNPTEGIFTVEYEGEVIVDISIIDITGKEVYNNTINKTSQINISYLHKGLYFVRMIDESSKTILTKKLIVR